MMGLMNVSWNHVTDGHEEYSFHDLNSFEEIEGNEYTQSCSSMVIWMRVSII